MGQLDSSTYGKECTHKLTEIAWSLTIALALLDLAPTTGVDGVGGTSSARVIVLGEVDHFLWDRCTADILRLA